MFFIASQDWYDVKVPAIFRNRVAGKTPIRKSGGTKKDGTPCEFEPRDEPCRANRLNIESYFMILHRVLLLPMPIHGTSTNRDSSSPILPSQTSPLRH